MKRRIVSLVSALILATNLVFADDAVQPECVAQLEQISSQEPSIKERFHRFIEEVKATKGLRLFLKDSPQYQEVTKWGGLVTYYEPGYKTGLSRYLDSILQFIPRQFGRLVWGDGNYRLSPIKGSYDIAIKNPVRAVTRRFSEKEKVPTLLVHIPFVFLLTMLAYARVDAAYTKGLEHKRESQISTFAIEYDHAILSDFRYSRIRQQLQNGQITKEEAHREAYLVSMAYSQYYKYRDSNTKPLSLQSEKALLNHYLFIHLKNVIKNGVKPAEGFYIPKSALGQLSETQMLQLFEANHLLYLKYQLIVELVKRNQSVVNLQIPGQITELKTEVMNDSFYQALNQKRIQRKITQDQFVDLLQENAYWQTKFIEWQIIGVTKLKKVNDRHTDEPLTLWDIQQEILASL